MNILAKMRHRGRTPEQIHLEQAVARRSHRHGQNGLDLRDPMTTVMKRVAG